MIIAGIWDAVNDPMFGAAAERKNSKKRRFRPYIFYGAPFPALPPVIMGAISGSGSFTAGSCTRTILICAICEVPLFYFVYANGKEVIRPVSESVKVSVGQSIKTVLTNKPLMRISAMPVF